MADPSQPCTSPFDAAAAAHLLSRAGFGGTPQQCRALAAMGRKRAIELLVDFESVEGESTPEGLFRSDIRRPATAEERRFVEDARRSQDEAALERIQQERNRRDSEDRAQLTELRRWWMRRMVESPRPLEEKLTLFWHSHFATGYRTVQDSYLLFLQNGLLRRHAAGNFADLVFAILRDPAMLSYLDANENRRQSPNENLARELMELFVLGEGHGYTEGDIKEGARALTGYTFSDDEFAFDEGNHDWGEKTILGRTGEWDGDGFARIILSRPESSEYLATKLYRYFVDDAPNSPDADGMRLVQAMAQTMRDGQYSLPPVLRQMFASDDFDRRRGCVVKSPVQLMVQSIRTMELPVDDVMALVQACDLMGQQLLQPPNVKGWAGGRSWINTSTYFVRQNALVYLLTGQRPDRDSFGGADGWWDPQPLLADLGVADASSAATADALAATLLAINMSPTRRDEMAALIESHGLNRRGGAMAAVQWISALPEFQLT